MKNIARCSIIAASLALAAGAQAATAPATGYVDFNAFAATANGQVVEVKVDAGLLRFAAKLAATKEPEAAKLIQQIESVRVNVVELSEANQADAVAKITAVRSQLEAAGWAPTVKVRDPKKGEDVAIYIRPGADDSIAGIVVTVLETGKQAVFVNVVGNLRPEQLAELGKRLDVDVLKKIEVHPAKEVAKQT